MPDEGEEVFQEMERREEVPPSSEMKRGGDKPRILFVSTHAGTRARVAEGFAAWLGSGKVEVCASGFAAGRIDSLAIVVMREVGIQVPIETPKTVFDRHRDKEAFDHVVTLCERGSLEHCDLFNMNVDALFAEMSKRLSWSVPSFDSIGGADTERWQEARKIRDRIREEVEALLSSLGVHLAGRSSHG